MKFKDVAHLYLGCKIINEALDGKYYNKNEGVLNLVELNEVISSDGVWKPLLRPLSDITEEEDKHRAKIWVDNCEKSIAFTEALRTNYLLKQGFDLFNLHESGECLYRNDKGELY